MSNKTNLVSVRVRNIKYDFDDIDVVSADLPKRLTVKVDEDMLYVVSNVDDGFGNLDESELIGELIEERVGFPVISFEYCI